MENNLWSTKIRSPTKPCRKKSLLFDFVWRDWEDARCLSWITCSSLIDAIFQYRDRVSICELSAARKPHQAFQFISLIVLVYFKHRDSGFPLAKRKHVRGLGQESICKACEFGIPSTQITKWPSTRLWTLKTSKSCSGHVIKRDPKNWHPQHWWECRKR